MCIIYCFFEKKVIAVTDNNGNPIDDESARVIETLNKIDRACIMARANSLSMKTDCPEKMVADSDTK